MLGKFTPGPWTVEETAETYWIGTVRANTHKVGEVITGMDHGPYTEEAEARIHANANLIAAAPEIYEALKGIVDFCDDPDPIPTMSLALGLAKLLIPAREALSKAEGRTQ